jgi:hypothetical protein
MVMVSLLPQVTDQGGLVVSGAPLNDALYINYSASQIYTLQRGAMHRTWGSFIGSLLIFFLIHTERQTKT